jgi:hypothetical protein
MGAFDEEFVEALAGSTIELGLLVVVTADASSLSEGAKLLAGAKPWACARFVVDNRLRGNPDPAVVKRLAGDATITTLAKREFEPRTLRFLQAMGLVAIPSAISSRGMKRPFDEPIPLRRSRFPAALIYD